MPEKWIDRTPELEVVALSDVATSVLDSSTDSQVPSAKCLYDLLGDVERQLDIINYGDNTPKFWGLNIVAEEPGAKVNTDLARPLETVGLVVSRQPAPSSAPPPSARTKP